MGPEVIAALAQKGQGIKNTLSTIASTALQRYWSVRDYKRQRTDALADYQMQNEYNSPSAQMARLKQAGINPVMAFKGGVTEAAPIRSSDIASTKAELPLSQSGGYIASYQDAQLKEATIENTRQNNLLLKQQEIMQEAQRIKTIAETAKISEETAKTKFEREQAQQLSQYVIQAAAQNVRKIDADIDRTVKETEVLGNRDSREALLNASTLKEAAARIANIKMQTLHEKLKMAKTAEETKQVKEQIEYIKKQKDSTEVKTQLDKLDKNLKEKGLQPGDALYFRAAAQYLDGIFDNNTGTKNPSGTGYLDSIKRKRQNH